jgi:hypothetical protein
MYREYQLININVYKIHIYAQIIHHMQWLPHAGMVTRHGISDFKAEFKNVSLQQHFVDDMLGCYSGTAYVT